MPTLRGGRKLTWSAFERRISDGRPACDLSDLRFVDAWGLVASAQGATEGLIELVGNALEHSGRGQAIDLALTYLVSPVPNRGRGQGLTTTAELVTKLQGRIAIRTGMARLDLDTTTHWQNVVALSGTIVGMSMPLYPGA